jgi:hypothetical protein
LICPFILGVVPLIFDLSPLFESEKQLWLAVAAGSSLIPTFDLSLLLWGQIGSDEGSLSFFEGQVR